MKSIKIKTVFVLLALMLSLQSLQTKFFNDNIAKAKAESVVPAKPTIAETVESCGLNITAKSAFLMDYHTKTCMFEKNANDKLPIASMCKIMTLLLTFEGIEKGSILEEESITVSENASSMGGSQAFLRANEKYLVSDLIKSIVIASANDSCVAIAERLSGSVDAFVHEMNEKALSLGMNDTVFQNCTGLPKPGQFSTAKDVATMLCALISHPAYFKYSQIWLDAMPHQDGTHTELTNTNKLVRFYEGCDGGKTGFTQEAKFCLAATAKRNDLRLISVIIGAESGKIRFAESSNLLSYGFANYVNEKVVSADCVLEECAMVKNGKQSHVQILPQKDVYCLLKRGEKPLIQQTINLNILHAPVAAGDIAGTLSVYREGVLVDEVPVICAENVKKRTLKDILLEIPKHFRMKNSSNA